jgi:ABC-type sugar transport system substrate-binding protein
MAVCVQGRARLRKTGFKLLAAMAVVALAACSNTTASTNSSSTAPAVASSDGAAADPKAVAATIKRAFLKDIPADSLSPAVRKTMEVASAPFTPAMEAKLRECLRRNVCETGRGTLTIAFPNDNINPWRQTFRAEITAQAIASPDVAKIIYSYGSDIASWLANFKSLIAQKPDIIVMNTIWGAAVLPAVTQAKAAGIVVVEAETPLPPEVRSVVDVEAVSDLCQAYTEGAELVAAEVGKPASYALYTGIPGNASAANWQPCLNKGLTDAGWTKALEGFTQWTPQGMTQAANSLYASGKAPAAIAYDYTMEYFAAPYLKDKKTPPIMISDVVNYSYLKQLKDAQAAGTDAKAFVANSRVWYGRIGLTAGIMVKQGQKVDKRISIPYPMVNANDVLATYDPAMPANAPVPTLFTPALETDVLSAGS